MIYDINEVLDDGFLETGGPPKARYLAQSFTQSQALLGARHDRTLVQMGVCSANQKLDIITFT